MVLLPMAYVAAVAEVLSIRRLPLEEIQPAPQAAAHLEGIWQQQGRLIRLLDGPALGASLGNFAKDGGEFSGAARDYFASPAFRETPPQLLIWEIPERDLQSPYKDDIELPAL